MPGLEIAPEPVRWISADRTGVHLALANLSTAANGAH